MTKQTVTTSDVITMINLIDICSERGAFKGNELFTIGQLREKLHGIANQTDEEETKPEKKMNNDNSIE